MVVSGDWNRSTVIRVILSGSVKGGEGGMRPGRHFAGGGISRAKI